MANRSMLDPTSDRSLADQLADILRTAIHSGSRSQGSQLPSEREFENDYGVSRTVVRDALDALVLEGLVVKRKGFGTFVRRLPPVRRVSSRNRHDLHRTADKPVFDVEAALNGRVPSRQLLSVGREQAPADVAQWLEIEIGAIVVVRRRLQLLDDNPAVISASYYPLWLAEGTMLESSDALKRGPDAEIEALGHPPAWGTEVFRARMPNPQERRLLALDAGVPVVRMLHIDYTETNRPLQVADDLYAADQHEFAFMWTSEEGPAPA
ncbi:GntR family transcriptional regulator [Kribbella sandramycini]|uniref:GntR family transcriptional regulator n=1 Tax=Kribbella sandramycini TaxID=60450 RepID=A0A7Y4KXF4_9ACTN|nr:GntR family transcriptional regulator [Kribbella sandramycini]MBB6569724.1 GntR family transcriptional regulator [Kribbella sandramycini]NOL40447.1 GntR family transcriptional regulator [Kribbella sandramycini]